MIPLKISRLFLILFIAGSCTQNIYAQTPGVECGCDTIGPYVAPYSKAIKVEDGPSLQEGTSPGGKYTLEATPATYPNIVHLNIKCGSNSILSITSRATGWGFSPDGDRFVMHGMTTDGGKHWFMLYNLDPDPSVSGEDADLVKHSPGSFVTSASLRFSPHGKYLLYAALGHQNELILYVYDTKTGESRHSISGGAPIVGFPSGKSIAGWGFSPDEVDRTFVHAYHTSWETYSFIAKNLETGEIVMSALNQYGIASFKFSLFIHPGLQPVPHVDQRNMSQVYLTFKGQCGGGKGEECTSWFHKVSGHPGQFIHTAFGYPGDTPQCSMAAENLHTLMLKGYGLEHPFTYPLLMIVKGLVGLFHMLTRSIP